MPAFQSPVFTVFNHGTCASRDGQGEIVAEFGRLAAGVEYRDFLICDGPGSNPTTSAIPGQFNPFTRDKQKKAFFGSKEMGHTHHNWQATGIMTGAGWDDNVMHAVATIAELNPPPKTVNMLGWSRGAVTCTKLAYKLREIFPDIAVNIFAVDPVAGIGNKSDDDASTIRGNVKNYLAVLSMHETRGFFKPQDAKRVTFTNGATNAIYVPFPGNHSGQVNLDKTVKKDLGESAQMVWFLAWKFLDHFGTRFTAPPSPNYSGLEQCNLYAKMIAKMPGYKNDEPGVFTSRVRRTQDAGLPEQPGRSVRQILRVFHQRAPSPPIQAYVARALRLGIREPGNRHGRGHSGLPKSRVSFGVEAVAHRHRLSADSARRGSHRIAPDPGRRRASGRHFGPATHREHVRHGTLRLKGEVERRKESRTALARLRYATACLASRSIVSISPGATGRLKW